MIKLNKLAIQYLKDLQRSGEVSPNSSSKVLVAMISSCWRKLWSATKAKSERDPRFSEREEAAGDVIVATMAYLQHIGCDSIEDLIRSRIGQG